MLYQIFNEPMVTMRTIQKLALVVLLLQVVYIFFLRSKTMIPFQILNFMMCTLYVHSQLMHTPDFRRKIKTENESAQRI